MATSVDLYLRDQIIRGELPAGNNRPLDVFNNALEGFVILSEASVQSMHVECEPIMMGPARVQKSNVLLVVPHDPPSTFRGVWVEKAAVRVRVGLGPLTVTGTFHVGPWERAALDTIARSSDGRSFLPATDAEVRSLYGPDLVEHYPSIFLAQHFVSYACLLSAPLEQAAPPEPRLIHETRRFR